MTTREELEEALGYKLPAEYSTGRCAGVLCTDDGCVRATHPGVVTLDEKED